MKILLWNESKHTQNWRHDTPIFKGQVAPLKTLPRDESEFVKVSQRSSNTVQGCVNEGSQIAGESLFLSILAIILSSISISIDVHDQWLKWYVPPRADLSIIDNFVYSDFSNNTLGISIDGIITNEGERSTVLKSYTLRYSFHYEYPGDELIISINKPISNEFYNTNLGMKESTNFTIKHQLNIEEFKEYNITYTDFKEFHIIVTYDDGISQLQSARSLHSFADILPSFFSLLSKSIKFLKDRRCSISAD